MTEQEAIREELCKLGHYFMGKYFGRDISVKQFNEKINETLSHLRSQGVMLKVKCPDCEWSQFKGESVGMTPCFRCNSTGYIFEPLIKET